jgi:segregation and condensation protein B
LDDQQLKSAIEALLFIGGGTLSVERLKGIFEDASKEQIEAQLQTLKEEYTARGAGVMLAEVANGWQLATCPEQASWVRKFKTVKVTTRLSRPALETLAIIAYKQPVTRPEIEAIRGVNIGGIVRNLMERRLVKIVGKKDIAGRPMLYGTSVEFLQYFGLKDLSSLPTLKEFQELEAGEDALLEQREDNGDESVAGEPDPADAGQNEGEEAADETATSEATRQE